MNTTINSQSSIVNRQSLDLEIDLIQHADVRKLVRAVLDVAPECFWSMPASTSGKYHPASSLGTGGLIRHTKTVVVLTDHLCEMRGTGPVTREYSICIAAAILHDVCKKLDHEQHTSFLHPLRAQELIISTAEQLWPGCMELPRATVEDALTTPAPGGPTIRAIADCVASHMGRWNVNDRTGEILPTPLTPIQRLVHAADYLASRKDISIASIG